MVVAIHLVGEHSKTTKRNVYQNVNTSFKHSIAESRAPRYSPIKVLFKLRILNLVMAKQCRFKLMTMKEFVEIGAVALRQTGGLADIATRHL